jgi:F0F1-type ATP synthase beta subunit
MDEHNIHNKIIEINAKINTTEESFNINKIHVICITTLEYCSDKKDQTTLLSVDEVMRPDQTSSHCRHLT